MQSGDTWISYTRLEAIASYAGKRFAAFANFSCNLGPRKLKCVHVTISCLDGHPRKFIREKLQDGQTLKILYHEISQYMVFYISNSSDFMGSQGMLAGRKLWGWIDINMSYVCS